MSRFQAGQTLDTPAAAKVPGKKPHLRVRLQTRSCKGKDNAISEGLWGRGEVQGQEGIMNLSGGVKVDALADLIDKAIKAGDEKVFLDAYLDVGYLDTDYDNILAEAEAFAAKQGK